MLDIDTSIYNETNHEDESVQALGQFKISLAHSIRTSHGWRTTSYTVSQLREIFEGHDVVDQKDKAVVFFPGELIEGRRTKTSVASISLLVFDIDDGRSLDLSLECITNEGLQAFVYSTFSSTVDNPKCRVVLPLRKPFLVDQSSSQTLKQSEQHWREFYTSVADRLRIQFDASCVDVSRCYFAPSCKADSEVFTLTLEGKLLELGSRVSRPVGPSRQQLKRWLTRYSHTFEIETALRRSAPAHIFRSERGSKPGVHIECPYEHTHSEAGGTGTFVINASQNENRGFGVHCCHQHCLADRGNGTRVDRLFFVEEMLKLNWLKLSDLEDVVLGGGQINSLRKSTKEIIIDSKGHALDIAKFKDIVIQRGLLDFGKLESICRQSLNRSAISEDIAYLIGEGLLHVNDLRLCILDEVSAQTASAYDCSIYDAAKRRLEPQLSQRELEATVSDISREYDVKARTVRIDIEKMKGRYASLRSDAIGFLSPLDVRKAESVTEFCKTYARLLQGGRSYILDMTRETLSDALLQAADFKQLHADKWFEYVDSHGQTRRFLPAAEFADYPPRGTRVYSNGLVFKPKGHVGPEEFNLFQGFKVDPDPSGDYSLLTELLRDVWCDGDSDGVAFLREWLMHILAHPADKIRTALVVRGGQGDGKSIVFDQLMKPILGHMMMKITNDNIILGGFNEPLVGKLLTVFEEAAFAGDKKKFEDLKEIITGDKIVINAKYKAPIEINNFCRVVLITNNDHAAQIKAGDRRYSVFETSSNWQNSTKHLQLIEQLQNGGAARFLYDALNHSFRTIPGTQRLVIDRPHETRAKAEQIALSRSPIEEFVVNALMKGQFCDDSFQGVGIPVAWRYSETCAIESQTLLDYANKFMSAKPGIKKPTTTMRTLITHVDRYYGPSTTIRPKLPNPGVGSRMQGQTQRVLPARQDALNHALKCGLITQEEHQAASSSESAGVAGS